MACKLGRKLYSTTGRTSRVYSLLPDGGLLLVQFRRRDLRDYEKGDILAYIRDANTNLLQ